MPRPCSHSCHASATLTNIAVTCGAQLERIRDDGIPRDADLSSDKAQVGAHLCERQPRAASKVYRKE